MERVLIGYEVYETFMRPVYRGDKVDPEHYRALGTFRLVQNEMGIVAIECASTSEQAKTVGARLRSKSEAGIGGGLDFGIGGGVVLAGQTY